MSQWDLFFLNKLQEIIKYCYNILDIGSSITSPKGTKRYNIVLKNCNYKSLDIDLNVRPDIVADIHHLSLQNDSFDGVICNAVLEHVYNPIQACSEIYRILKKGGKCLVYVPFLYGYHASSSYKDYYRYTEDGIRYLFRHFTSIEICPVRGNIETVLTLTSFKAFNLITPLARFIDKYLSYKQVSGYYAFMIK